MTRRDARRGETASAGALASNTSDSLFGSIDLTSSFLSPTRGRRGDRSSATHDEQDWTATLDVPSGARSSPLLSPPRTPTRSTRPPPSKVRRVRSTAQWSITSSASFPAADEAWEQHLARAPPPPPVVLPGRRSLSLSLDGRQTSAPSSTGTGGANSPRSSRPSRRSPSLSLPPTPAWHVRAPSPAVSWHAQHTSYTVGGEVAPHKGVRKTLSMLSLGGLMDRDKEKEKKGRDEGLFLPPEPVRTPRRIEKGSWEYQVAEALIFGGTPPASTRPHPSPSTRPSPRRPPVKPLNLAPPSAPSSADPFLSAPSTAPLTPPASALLTNTSPHTPRRSPSSPRTPRSLDRSASFLSLASNRSSLDSTASSTSFHSAHSFVPFPALYPAQSPTRAQAHPYAPPLHAVKGALRASIQYAIPARTRSRASLTSLVSFTPPLTPACVVDLAALARAGAAEHEYGKKALTDVAERTEQSMTFTDDLTVVMPFPPRTSAHAALPGADHRFPPSPPVLPHAQRQPSKRGRLARAPLGAWLFVGGFVLPVLWWVGAGWPWEFGRGKERGKAVERDKGIRSAKVRVSLVTRELEKQELTQDSEQTSTYTHFPRARARSRAESAVNGLLGDGPGLPTLGTTATTAAEQQRARELVWRRRNRLMALLSVVVLAAVIGFAAWGATR
ncbi:hypothetical protein JCM10207_005415 [Rhodosporidiobolus poonsookiae]